MWDFHLGRGSSAPGQVRIKCRECCFSVGICWVSKAEQPQRKALISTWFCWNVVDSLPSPLSFPYFTSRTDRTIPPGPSEAMNPSGPTAQLQLLECSEMCRLSKSLMKVQRAKSCLELFSTLLPRMGPFPSAVWARHSSQRLCALGGPRCGRAGMLLWLSHSPCDSPNHTEGLTGTWTSPKGATLGTVRACWLLPSPTSSLTHSSATFVNTAPGVFFLSSWKLQWLQSLPVGNKKS